MIYKILCLLCFSFTVNAAQFAGACDGVTDDTPALNAQIAALQNSNDKEIRFPASQCAFYSQPDALDRSVSLIGQSKSATVLVRKYSGTFLTIYGQGSRIENLTIFADTGTTGGYGITMLSDETHGSGGNHVIEHVWITGYGTWGIPLFGDGSGRISSPLGLRDVSINDLSVFNATFWAAECWDCVAFEWFGGGAYQGYGTTQSLAVGGANSAKNYINANIDYAASTFWSGAMR